VTVSGYQIVPYRSGMAAQALDVLRLLWGENQDNGEHLQWKYSCNPYADKPLAVVALHQGQVVGFRGFFPLRYWVPGKQDSIWIAAPGDTVVHPDHRRKGLSMATLRFGMQLLQPLCCLLLNMTCNEISLPGYLKAGFVPLTMRIFLSRSTLAGILQHGRQAKDRLPLRAAGIGYGRFGDLVVSSRPWPEEMAGIVAQQTPPAGRLQLVKDSTFFCWRFGSPRRKYVFYYLMVGEVACAYVALLVSPNNQRAYIVDYAEAQPGAVEMLLRHLIRARHFGILSIYRFCVADGLRPALQRLRFTEHGLVGWFERRMHGEHPAIIRPVRERFADSDYCVAGLDLREIGNWALTQVCSDGV
jgi:GNAT superfamily N-acetyltransferase